MRRDWLIQKRVEKNISQKEMAELCGVVIQTISNIEVGNKAPSGKLALKIARVLDFDMSLFFDEEIEKEQAAI